MCVQWLQLNWAKKALRRLRLILEYPLQAAKRRLLEIANETRCRERRQLIKEQAKGTLPKSSSHLSDSDGGYPLFSSRFRYSRIASTTR